MKEAVRTKLEAMEHASLVELSKKLLENDHQYLDDDQDLIKALMQQYRRVGKSLGIKPFWAVFSRNHIYGLASLFGFFLAVWSLFISNRAAPVSKMSSFDQFTQKSIRKTIREEMSAVPDVQLKQSPRRIDVLEESLPKNTVSGFNIKDFSVVLDLRTFKYLHPVERGNPVSPVVQKIKQIILNTEGDDTYRMRATTSGLDVYSRSLTHSGEKLTVYATDELNDVSRYKVKQRVLEFDVSDNPKDREFVIQATKTFWNAFQGEERSWAGVIATVSTQSINYLILFPENKPFTSMKYFTLDENGINVNLPADAQVLEDPNGRWIWWRIVEPQAGYMYNMDWEW